MLSISTLLPLCTEIQLRVLRFLGDSGPLISECIDVSSMALARPRSLDCVIRLDVNFQDIISVIKFGEVTERIAWVRI